MPFSRVWRKSPWKFEAEPKLIVDVHSHVLSELKGVYLPLKREASMPDTVTVT